MLLYTAAFYHVNLKTGVDGKEPGYAGAGSKKPISLLLLEEVANQPATQSQALNEKANRPTTSR